MTTIIGSLVVSILLFALLTLSGLGFGRLLGLKGHPYRLLLAPTILVSVLAFMLVLSVMAGIPLVLASPLIWTVIIASAVYGAWSPRELIADKSMTILVLISIFTSALVLAGFMWNGIFDYLGSPNQDGFTYVAFGEYLRQFPRGSEGGLAPLYQYGSHLSATRYVAAATLAILIPPGSAMDTQMMVGPLLLLGTYAFSISIAYVACVVKDKGIVLSPHFSVVLAVLGGWFPFVLLANNFDNLIVLSLAPALFGLGLDDRLMGRARWLLPSVMCAAAIYIYPELGILVIVGYYFAGLDRIPTSARNQQIFLWISVAVVTLVFILPYVPEAVRFFQSQLALTKTVAGPRPGNGFMPDLLVLSRLPAAIWGFQSGTSTAINSLGLIVGTLLALMMILGCWVAKNNKIYSLCMFIGVALLLLAVMIGIKRYDYGAYKIMLFAWWAMALAISIGGGWLVSRPESARWAQFLTRASLAVVCLGLMIWGMQQWRWSQGFAYTDAKLLREARERMEQIGGPVSVVVSDPILGSWMVYQLRHLPVAYPTYGGYLAQVHVLPVMARSNAPVDGGRYVLVGANDEAQGEVLWHNEMFKLLERREGEGVVIFGQMQAPNGVEQVDGDVFIWLGHDAATIELQSSKAGSAVLDLEAIGGTSVADSKAPLSVTVSVQGDSVSSLDLYRGPKFSVRVPVELGVTRVGLLANYDSSVGANPNGDMRILLAGVRVRSLRFEE